MKDSYVRWKRWHDSKFGQFLPEEAIYFSLELGTSGIRSVHQLAVAELGFGNGAFAGWVRAAGGRWVGREVLAELQVRAKEEGFEVIAPDANFSSACGQGTFDLIAAFDVIEHLSVDAIKSFLDDAKKALKPGGLLFLRVPSGDSPFSGAMYYGDLTHRTLLGSSAANQLALEAGLEVCEIRSPILPLWNLGLKRCIRRAAVHFFQALAFSFIRVVLMGNSKAVVSPNMMIVLRKREPG
jgi:SAM-dependent methyltransferase